MLMKTGEFGGDGPNDYDSKKGHQAAIEAEQRACAAITEALMTMCENDDQRMVAITYLTAAMITKFDTGRIFYDGNFSEIVDEIIAVMRPEAERQVRAIKELKL